MPCPRCGRPLVPRTGRAGAFLGCPSFPRCRGSAPVLGPRPTTSEHPIAATRRLALERLAEIAPGWSADDREDAASEALAAAIAGGWAARPEAWTFVARRALRALRGWQMQAGRRCSARSGATPAATAAVQVRDPDTGEIRDESPSAWLERAGARPPIEDMIDAAPRVRAWVRARVEDAGGSPLARVALRGRDVREVARAIGVHRSTAYRWGTGETVPADRYENALRDIAAARRDGAPLLDPQAAAPGPRCDDAESQARALAALDGMSTRAAARMLGVSQPTASLWRSGKRPLPLDRARQILALGTGGAL